MLRYVTFSWCFYPKRLTISAFNYNPRNARTMRLHHLHQMLQVLHLERWRWRKIFLSSCKDKKGKSVWNEIPWPVFKDIRPSAFQVSRTSNVLKFFNENLLHGVLTSSESQKGVAHPLLIISVYLHEHQAHCKSLRINMNQMIMLNLKTHPNAGRDPKVGKGENCLFRIILTQSSIIHLLLHWEQWTKKGQTA